MLTRRLFAAAIPLAAAFAASGARAQAHPGHPPQDVSVVEHQLMVFREELKKAVEAKDVDRLRTLYADTFTHTHGSGKVDGKDARIVSLLARDPVIEIGELSEVSVRVHGPDMAILTARSPILNKTENRVYDFRWIQVFTRVDGQWQLAASQATRLPVVS